MPADPHSWQRLMEAFSKAVELTPGPERDSFLARRLGDDPALLAEAIAMLRAHEDPLDIDKKLLNCEGSGDLSGTLIGSYRLVRLIARKMLAPEEHEAAPITRYDVRIMTIDYAAPEQVRGDPITTATDIYGLGALLYELLTGERPFAAVGGGRSSLERAILEVEPETPSLVAARKALPVSARLKGDLDTIVQKAMAKEPEQRFASAEEFTRDLERYLAGEPVTARKPSLSYRLSKFVRRNRFGAAATVTSVLLLFGLAATIVLQSWRVARERDLARVEQAGVRQESRHSGGLASASSWSRPPGLHSASFPLRILESQTARKPAGLRMQK